MSLETLTFKQLQTQTIAWYGRAGVLEGAAKLQGELAVSTYAHELVAKDARRYADTLASTLQEYFAKRGPMAKPGAVAGMVRGSHQVFNVSRVAKLLHVLRLDQLAAILQDAVKQDQGATVDIAAREIRRRFK